MAALAEQQVEVELLRQPLVELDRGVVEARALGRLVVRAQDRRVAAGRARADVALLEHRDVGDAALLEVVRGREAVRAAADDHDVVAVLELRPRPPHAALAEDVTHRRRLLERSASTPTGPPPRWPAASATTVHTYCAVGGAERASGSGPRPRRGSQPRRARDRARAPVARRRDLRAQVERAEARERLARQRAGEPQRAEARSVTSRSPPASAPRRRGPARASASSAATCRRRRRGRAAELERARRLALQLVLAQVRDVGEADRVRSGLAASEATRRRSSRRGARSARRRRAPGAPSASAPTRRPLAVVAGTRSS